MVDAARRWMDVVMTDNLLEHFPAEHVDAAVFCNTLEPYASNVRKVALEHAYQYLNPGGRIIIAAALGTSSVGSGSDCGLNMIFPTVDKTGLNRPDEIEDD